MNLLLQASPGPAWYMLGFSAITALVTAVGAFYAAREGTRVSLQFIRRDVEELKHDSGELDERIRAHGERIVRVETKVFGNGLHRQ